MLTGCFVLLTGALITFVAIITTTIAAFLLGTAVAGVGFGLAQLGVFRTLVPLAAPAEQSGLIAAIFIVSYLAFSIPAVIAGIATSHFGLHDTAIVYSLAIAALVTATAGGLLLRTPITSGSHEPGPAPDDPPKDRCTPAAGR
jgi:MFS family permease